ncbi:MAG: sulfotransferase [Sphingomonas sp.]|uniref:sulfotransferase family protein n=1 Tax=Sphingomonas sp. TaxID=28214 RepID=UPI002273B61B|nr:sulfotransferase [Sphingomonas sp.]MCX8476800.1 sulfotransferase [Sphingomonas sp.]
MLYIAGYGRSGTTLLDIALGQHPAIMGGGEIATLARHVWPNDEYCACGVPVRQCAMWSGIVAQWSKGEAPTLIDDFRRAQERTETILGLGRFLERVRSSPHASRTVKLFEAIAAGSGSTIVVDSSKLPGRASVLAETRGIELAVVHVVRDPRGVAWSLKKGYKRQVDVGLQRELRPKPLLYTALRWMIVNLATERLCRRLGAGRALRIKYEDFVADPEGTLRQILKLVHSRIPEQPLQVAVSPMSPQHQVAGSRHRMQHEIVVRHDERWKETMPRLQRWLVTLACAPLLWRYGYSLRTSAPTGRKA